MSSTAITRADVCNALEMLAHHATEMSCHICSMIGDESEPWKSAPTLRDTEVNSLDEGALDAMKVLLRRFVKRFNEKDQNAVRFAVSALECYLEDLQAGAENRELRGIVKFAWEENQAFIGSVLEALKAGKVVHKPKQGKK